MMTDEAKNQFINELKKENSRKTDDAKETGDRLFETREDADEALKVAQEAVPDRKFTIDHKNGKFILKG
ncbi:hypothetical protein IV38_GL001672 [Lactobacillus selangorensis]|uniref:Uncharacterized protein n=1 Tax=Lactobacillus selangorensis TaxID=81857 RepID=A0A0R2G0F0_9LACO|nr:hypothetical protein [Lactobacillus selangorensis]KRN28218.1 hypothetical protein IV38_GL001672 [Lactobacillus selangorensis]KRN30906.1 hypothetical protein IV40_GL001543 [Lactobacillus selangorensis]